LNAVVDRYLNTDTEIFELSALATGSSNFDGNIGTYPATYFGEGHLASNDPVWAREYDRLTAIFFRTMDTAGLPVFSSLINRAKSIGIFAWGSIRMAAWYMPVSGQTYNPFNGDIWSNHPEWRNITRSGSRGYQMSLAFPEVQDMIIGKIEKMVRLGCEGINMDFCRYPYVLDYETPLITGFMQLYPEVDPRTLPGDDLRWIAYRQSIMNNFFEDMRTKLDTLETELGRSIEISIRIPVSSYEIYGFDPQYWIDNGLVDILIPHCLGNEKDFDIQPWVEMVDGTNVMLYPGVTSDKKVIGETELTDAAIAAGMVPGQVIKMSADDYRRRVRQRNDADGGLYFNDWSATKSINLLGDKEYLKQWSYFEDVYNQPRVNVTIP
jgi:hypothetical protein